MTVPGVLLRLSNTTSSPPLPGDLPNVEAIYTLKAADDDDGRTPSHNTVCFLSDITPLLSSEAHYNADAAAHRDLEASSLALSWVVCSFVNGRDSQGYAEPQTSRCVLPAPPAPGSVVVVNGSTPRPDKEADYHAWYDQEHGLKLTQVPGWWAARRYALAKVYGETETANFYGINFYDADNGLGGPEWQAGVTEWTLRIRSNAAKPNIRRVWKVEGTQ